MEWRGESSGDRSGGVDAPAVDDGMSSEAYSELFHKELAKRINHLFFEASRRIEARRFLNDLAELMQSSFPDSMRRA